FKNQDVDADIEGRSYGGLQTFRQLFVFRQGGKRALQTIPPEIVAESAPGPLLDIDYVIAQLHYARPNFGLHHAHEREHADDKKYTNGYAQKRQNGPQLVNP